ncbi:hypothetical protein HNR22_001724 [Micromonospora jinlongensis]|uniref:Uncharacterized protein n=1 Tax=Micromonospora jinlongensis TaxID=1287877 RepID=A0A7Z0BE47_9ACTN|nr:hypothetical protein [Micromonospora jinlongensis]NYH41997.1 hypothetical protein [Micromonospora jinlongensis]
MGVLADCLEAISTEGPGVFRYKDAASDSVVVDDRVYDLARKMVAPGTTALLVPDSASNSTNLRAYLHGLVATDVRVVVVPFSSRTSGPLDLDSALRLQDTLGVELALPGDVAQEGVPPGLQDRLTSLESTAELARTGEHASAYRLLPETLAANLRQLAELTTARQPVSVGELVSNSAAGGRRTTGGAGFVAGDLLPLAAVYYATFGDLPGLSLAELRALARPLSRRRLNHALGQTPVPMPLANVLQEFNSGRAVAALVHAPAGSPTPGSFWMVKGDDGQLRWETGTEPAVPVVLDGAVDRRTAVLEDPRSEIVVVGSDGVPYPPELPAEPTWAPWVSTNARRIGKNTILLGPDSSSTAIDEIVTVLNHHDGLIALVDVRRGAPSRHGTTLDALIAESLHRTLAKNPAISVVVATERNDELEFIVAEQHGRSSVQPTMVGFEKFWDVQGAGSAHRERYRSLTDGALARAEALAAPPKSGPSDLVAEFINQPTWKDVESYLQEHADDLLTGDVVQELADLESASVANGERISRYDDTQIRDSPFFREDRVLAAFRVLIKQEMLARKDPELVGKRPLEPQRRWLTDPVEPHTQTADSSLFLGYLTSRPLDEARLGEKVGDYEGGLLWLRELLQAMSNAEATKVSLADLVAVVRAKGELEEERAARRPGQAEIFRAHAAIVEAILDIVGGKGDAGRWLERLNATDCLTGADRVFWHFVLRDIIMPAFPEHKAELERMQNRINACYDKAGL